MTTSKNKDVTRAMRDISDLPPATFALPTDTRQAKHLQQQRKALALGLARHANADGTNVYPSAGTLAKAMGCHRRTIFNLLGDLKTLGFLQDGGINGFRKTRVRNLDISHMKGAAPVQSSPDSPVQSSESPVQSSPSTCAIFEGDPCNLPDHPCNLRTPPVQSSMSTQPFLDRSNKPSLDRPLDRDRETGVVEELIGWKKDGVYSTGRMVVSTNQWFNPQHLPKCPECIQPCAYEDEGTEVEIFETCGSENCETQYIAKLEASL